MPRHVSLQDKTRQGKAPLTTLTVPRLWDAACSRSQMRGAKLEGPGRGYLAPGRGHQDYQVVLAVLRYGYYGKLPAAAPSPARGNGYNCPVRND